MIPPGPGPGPWGIYVHVPWCRRRCPYCAFYVEVDRGADQDAFVDRILREHRDRGAPFRDLGRPATLFLGGGTPSRLSPERIARLVEGLDLAPDAEIALEVNPEDIDPASLAALRDAGVHRVSVGLQTFQPRFARLLNRASSVARAREAVAEVAAAGFRSWSVDLIFALPGQTLDDLLDDLQALAALAPPHVALYGLTIEPGTPLERARDQGRLVETDDETWRMMLDVIADLLEEAGLRRYEISNYARPGHESRHNTLYWSDRPYLGLGPSAHSYAPDGARWRNVADLSAWTARQDPREGVEHPDAWGAATDYLVSALRARDGADLAHLHARTGLRPDPAVVAALEASGLLRREAYRLRITREGIAVADGLTERIARSLGAA